MAIKTRNTGRFYPNDSTTTITALISGISFQNGKNYCPLSICKHKSDGNPPEVFYQIFLLDF